MVDDKSSAEHYVYLYRDSHGKVRYVGYGSSSWRATSHLTGSHNEQLNNFLRDPKYRIEISGPFDNEETGRAVETALISVLKPDFNVNPGRREWRFRPLGVPLGVADRQIEGELQLIEFLSKQGKEPTPVLFVIVTDVVLRDGRYGYDPANPPSDEQIRDRIDRWWQLGQFLPKWRANPKESPGLLIGVFGSPGRQTVIASARIEQAAWAKADESSHCRLSVPLVEPLNLDAFELRGRRVAREAGLRFGGIPAQFYIRLNLNEEVVGGRRQK